MRTATAPVTWPASPASLTTLPGLAWMQSGSRRSIHRQWPICYDIPTHERPAVGALADRRALAAATGGRYVDTSNTPGRPWFSSRLGDNPADWYGGASGPTAAPEIDTARRPDLEGGAAAVTCTSPPSSRPERHRAARRCRCRASGRPRSRSDDVAPGQKDRARDNPIPTGASTRDGPGPSSMHVHIPTPSDGFGLLDSYPGDRQHAAAPAAGRPTRAGRPPARPRRARAAGARAGPASAARARRRAGAGAAPRARPRRPRRAPRAARAPRRRQAAEPRPPRPPAPAARAARRASPPRPPAPRTTADRRGHAADAPPHARPSDRLNLTDGHRRWSCARTMASWCRGARESHGAPSHATRAWHSCAQ